MTDIHVSDMESSVESRVDSSMKSSKESGMMSSMVRKVTKTEHVIQKTDNISMSEEDFSKLVEMGVARLCLPHETELKHLSAEEIAQGDWTVEQMYDYLMYMVDFCGMPDNEPSIVFKESKYVTTSNIESNFERQKFGEIEKIDVLPMSNWNLDNHVFVHFKEWNTYYIDTEDTVDLDYTDFKKVRDAFIAKNENAIRTRFALITGKTIKLYYDKRDKSAFVEIMALRPEHLE